MYLYLYIYIYFIFIFVYIFIYIFVYLYILYLVIMTFNSFNLEHLIELTISRSFILLYFRKLQNSWKEVKNFLSSILSISSF